MPEWTRLAGWFSANISLALTTDKRPKAVLDRPLGFWLSMVRSISTCHDALSP